MESVMPDGMNRPMPTSTLEVITPKMAKEMLAANTDNRRLRPLVVGAISRDILNGDWCITGDAICFDWNGVMTNGQHRLRSCVESDETIETFVVRGLDPKAKLVSDTTLRRTAGDHFSFKGVKSANAVAAACRYAMVMRHPRMHSLTLTNAEFWNFLQENPGITDSMAMFHKAGIGMGSILAAAHYISTVIAPHISDDFAEAWIHGVGERGNPAITCRERIIKAQMSTHKMTTTPKIKLAAYSLAKMAKGEKTTVARPGKDIILPGWSK